MLLRDIPRTSSVTAVSAHCLLHTYLDGPTAWRGRVNALTDEQHRTLRPAPAESTASLTRADDLAVVAATTGRRTCSRTPCARTSRPCTTT